MSREDRRGVLPERGSALAEDEVLAALVERAWDETNGVEIAKRSRVPTATANRIISRMVSTGLVTHRYHGTERLVRINVASPLYSSTLARLWVRLGIQPSPLTLVWAGMRAPVVGQPGGGWDSQMSEVVPPSLHRPPEAPSEVPDGPPAPVARRLVLDLEALADRCAWMSDLLLDVATNDERRTGRDRDLWGRSLSGSGITLAAATLRAATVRSARDDNRRDHHELHAPERVSARTWILATYAVSSEALRYRIQEKNLDAASRAAKARYVAQSDAASARYLRARATSEEERRRGDLDVADEEAKAAKIEADITQRYGLYGAWQHVGTAGERLLAAESRLITAEAEKIAASMATEACVTQWQQENPEEAARYQLPHGPLEDIAGG